MNAQDVRTVRLVINSDQAKQKLDDINKRLEEARKKKQEAFERGDAEGISAYTKEIQKLEREARKMQTRAQVVERTLRNLDKATPKELNDTIKEINRQLNSGAVERGSEQWKSLTNSISAARAELKKIQDEQLASGEKTTFLAKWGQRWVGLTSIIDTATNAISNFMGTLDGYVNEYAEIAEHMAGVSKYTGMSAEEVDELNEAFKRMDTRTSRAALNDLAADAGRLGIQSKAEVLDFVEAANMLNVALGEDLGEGAVRNIGKLAELFGDSEKMGLKQAMLATGSTINELAQSSSANEGYIMDFTARLSGMAKQAGMTQAQVMGLAAVMDQAMVNAEEGSTALSRLIQVLYKEPEKLAKAVGLNVQEFSELVKKDANAALLEFAQAAERLGGMDKLAPILGDLSLTGAGVTKVITSLANSIDKVRATQQQATEAFNEATSAQREYDAANNTVQARLEKAQEQLANIRQEIGKRLLPIQERATASLTAFLQTLMAFAGILANNTWIIVTAAAAVATYTAASNLATAKAWLWTNAEKAKNAVMAFGHRFYATYRASILLLTQAYAAATGNTVLLRAASIKLHATLAANPYAILLTAVVAVGAAIYALAQRSKQLTSEQKQQAHTAKTLADVETEAAKRTSNTRTRVRLLTEAVHNNNLRLKERRSAIAELKKIVPGYNAQLTDEGKLLRDNTQAIEDYLTQLHKKARAEAAMAKLTEIEGQLMEAEMTIGRKRNNIAAVNRELDKAQYDREEYEWVDQDGRIHRDDRNLPERVKKEQERSVHERALAQAEQKQKELIAARNELDKVIDKAGGVTEALKQEADKAGGGTTSEKKGKGKSDALVAEFKRQQLALDVQRAAGLLTLRSYNEQTYQLEQAHYTVLRDLYKKGSAEYLEAEKKRLESDKKYREEQRAWSLQQIETEEREELKQAERAYLEGRASLEAYEQAKTDITLRHLNRRALLAMRYGDEAKAREYDRKYEELANADSLKRRAEFWRKADELRKEYLTKSAEEQRKTEEELAKQLLDHAVITAEEYQRILDEIQKKYTGKAKGSADSDPLTGSMDPFSGSLVAAFETVKKLGEALEKGEATWQHYAAIAVASLQVVAAGMQSVSQLFQAQQQAEEAKVNARYDAEIAIAGRNSRRAKRLEEQRQKELAKVKTKYAKKQMTMEMAQAVAQTAVAAINAYASASKVNWLLGPIAAAAATAAGMVQIAAIKKQHEAQAAGYYEGGFTGGNRYRREAGVVHEGEFVANHEAVGNPAILPVLRLIDQAQRANRVASLTATDVSRAIAAPVITANAATATAAAPALTMPSDPVMPRTAEAVERLNAQLERGIEAYVTIDGPQGFEAQYRKYNRLNKRK